jgi:hypothetical protein
MINITLQHPALNPHGTSHATYGSSKDEYCPKQPQSTGLFIIEPLRFSCELGTDFLKFNLD